MDKIKKWYINNRSTLLTATLLTIIIIIAAVLRFYQIGKPSFWNDEINTFEFATSGFKNMLWVDPNMSLYYLLVHFWVIIFPGASDGMLRSISAIFSVASIPVVFLLGRTLEANRKKAAAIGLIAAVLVAFNAYHLQYGQELRSYSLVFLLTTLSTFLLIKAIEEPDSRPYWGIWYIIASVAAVYSHFFAIFILAAQAVTLPVLLLGIKMRSFPFRGILCSGIFMVFLSTPIAVYAYMKGVSEISWIPIPTNGDVENFIVNITGNQGGLLPTFYLLSICIGLVEGVRTRFQKDSITKWKFTLMVSCLVLPVLMTLFISRVITPIFLDRYLLFIMPYMAILAAAGIMTLITPDLHNRKVGVIAIPIGIALFILISTLSLSSSRTYFQQFKKEDWREVSQFLSKKCLTSLRLYYVTNKEGMALYYNADLKSQVESWDKFLEKNPNSEEIAWFLPNGYKQACLVFGSIYHSYTREQLKNIQTALGTKFHKVTKVNFYELDVEIYTQ